MTAGESRSGRRERLDKLRESILHRKVLARHLPGLNGTFSGRWTRRQWAHASLVATLGALVAAVVPGFSGPAAGTMQASLSAPRITQALVLPALAAAPRQDIAHDNWRQVTVESGQTLGRIFEDLGLPASSMHRLLDAAKDRSALTRLRPGAVLGFDIAGEGQLRALRYERDDIHQVELSLVGGVIGTFIVFGLREFLSTVVPWWQYVLGVVYVATILYLPTGLMGIPERLRQRRAKSGNREETAKLAPATS